MSILAKIEAIESEMNRTQKNKATNAHLGQLKAKLAKLKGELIESTSGKKGPKQEGFEVQKTGMLALPLCRTPPRRTHTATLLQVTRALDTLASLPSESRRC